jgi:hypothetical protein
MLSAPCRQRVPIERRHDAIKMRRKQIGLVPRQRAAHQSDDCGMTRLMPCE